MNTFSLTVTGPDGKQINAYRLAFVTAQGNPIVLDGKPVVGEVTTGSYTANSDNANLYYKIEADGYKDLLVTLSPGANTAKLEKESPVQQAAAAVGKSSTLTKAIIFIVVVVVVYLLWRKFKGA